ncbi:hypothetical protein [Nonomuraea sp. NPDC050783]|uniref:hypothetical protein n=1 Tax=Nonomuraea sp. NPDC050783 TaxID=3154634 RepID=UPI003467B0B0
MFPDVADLGIIRCRWLRPYFSVIALRCVRYDPEHATQVLLDVLKKSLADQTETATAVLADGIEKSAGAAGLLVNGFIYRREFSPSWATTAAPSLVDLEHALVLTLRYKDLLVVHCDDTQKRYIRRWLRKNSTPLIIIAPEVLQRAFCEGETRALWLRGTHARRTTRPDAKALNGQRLQDALSPLEDSSFIYSSARTAPSWGAPGGPRTGNIGVTPKDGLIWSRASRDFEDFIAMAGDVLRRLDEVSGTSATARPPFPILATEVHSLSGVRGAYDLSTVTPGELVEGQRDEATVEAAALLERTTFHVQGRSDSAGFSMDVGLDGVLCGSIQAAVGHARNGGVSIEFGFDPSRAPTSLPETRQILDALRDSQGLIRIYFDSGHVIDGRCVYKPETRNAPFRGWQFDDFTGYDITREKPADSPARIHARTGEPGDDSLFSWVSRQYASGWLTCDDGPGEIADFIHVDEEGALSLIHVKSAKSRAKRREIAVAAYEAVAGQAAKNLAYLDGDRLLRRLESPPIPNPATWEYGTRVADRREMLVALGSRHQRDRCRVVIVQPHVTRTAIRKPSRRLALLETLLNTVGGGIAALGAEFTVTVSDE